jgi:hypothetical protein
MLQLALLPPSSVKMEALGILQNIGSYLTNRAILDSRKQQYSRSEKSAMKTS